MKNKLITLIVASLTLGVCAADHHSKDGKHKAKPAKVDGKRKLPRHMAKFDKNKDGKLCEAERKVAKAAFMKRFDKNKDGKLDEKERKAAMAERRKNAQKPKGKGKLPKGAKGKVKPEKKPAPKKG